MSKLLSNNYKYHVLFIAGIIIYIMMIVYPYHVSLTDLENDIKKINTQLYEQDMLYPVFKKLLNKARYNNLKGLPVLQNKKTAHNNTEEIADLFNSIADDCNLKVKSIMPDIDSLFGITGHLRLNISMIGKFENIRKLFIKVNKLPYLEHIEKIHIVNLKELKEIRMILWIAQS